MELFIAFLMVIVGGAKLVLDNIGILAGIAVGIFVLLWLIARDW